MEPDRMCVRLHLRCIRAVAVLVDLVERLVAEIADVRRVDRCPHCGTARPRPDRPRLHPLVSPQTRGGQDLVERCGARCLYRRRRPARAPVGQRCVAGRLHPGREGADSPVGEPTFACERRPRPAQQHDAIVKVNVARCDARDLVGGGGRLGQRPTAGSRVSPNVRSAAARPPLDLVVAQRSQRRPRRARRENDVQAGVVPDATGRANQTKRQPDQRPPMMLRGQRRRTSIRQGSLDPSSHAIASHISDVAHAPGQLRIAAQLRKQTGQRSVQLGGPDIPLERTGDALTDWQRLRVQRADVEARMVGVLDEFSRALIDGRRVGQLGASCGAARSSWSAWAASATPCLDRTSRASVLPRALRASRSCLRCAGSATSGQRAVHT